MTFLVVLDPIGNALPDILCKYTSLSTGEIVLRNRTLRWTTPQNLNDPFDMRFDMHVDFDRQIVRRMSLEKLWDAHYNDAPVSPNNMVGRLVLAFRGQFPSMSREEFDSEFGPGIDEGIDRLMARAPQTQLEVRGLLSKTKILCLSATPDNVLMWSHYASNHTGIVFAFRDAEGIDSPWHLAKAVNYVRDMPRLGDEELWSDIAAGRRNLDIPAIVDAHIYTKSSDWSHEQEWRLSSGHGRNEFATYEDITFHPAELAAIAFGCETPRSKIEELSAIARGNFPNARLMQVIRSQRGFSLSLCDLD